MEFIDIPFIEIDVIGRLWEKLNDFHMEKTFIDGGRFSGNEWKKRKESLLKKIDHPGHIKIILAEEGEEPAGYVVATLDGDAGEIDSLYIEEDFRNKGVGKALIEQAEDWFAEKKAKRIRISVVGGNADACAVYEHLGYNVREIIFEKALDG